MTLNCLYGIGKERHTHGYAYIHHIYIIYIYRKFGGINKKVGEFNSIETADNSR